MKYWLHAIGLFLFVQCSQEPDNITFQDENHQVILNELSPTHFQLISLNNQGDSVFWDLPYPVYRMQFADITNNGENNIIVGVEKTTRFDTTYQKRLFVFKYVGDEIRPKWLGSRLGMPIYDFHIQSTDSTNHLVVTEYERDSSFAIARYEWDRFGFKFLRYDKRKCSFKELNDYTHE